MCCYFGNKEDNERELRSRLWEWITTPVFYIEDGIIKTLEPSEPDKIMKCGNSDIPDVFLKAFED